MDTGLQFFVVFLVFVALIVAGLTVRRIIRKRPCNGPGSTAAGENVVRIHKADGDVERIHNADGDVVNIHR